MTFCLVPERPGKATQAATGMGINVTKAAVAALVKLATMALLLVLATEETDCNPPSLGHLSTTRAAVAVVVAAPLALIPALAV